MSKKTRSNSRAKTTISSYQHSVDNESYELTSAPILDQRFRNLPQSVQDEFNHLSAIAEINPSEAIPRLLQMLQQYPLPLVYSCLAIAYGRVDPEKQKSVIRENYKKNTKNLFARCNYARLCLAENNTDAIPVIFANHYELKTLYPKRVQFHITEYTALTSVICEYCFKVNELEQAEALLSKLEETAPESSEVKRMKELLHPTFWQRISNKLFG